jgi:hypothetical protein
MRQSPVIPTIHTGHLEIETDASCFQVGGYEEETSLPIGEETEKMLMKPSNFTYCNIYLFF